MAFCVYDTILESNITHPHVILFDHQGIPVNGDEESKMITIFSPLFDADRPPPKTWCLMVTLTSIGRLSESGQSGSPAKTASIGFFQRKSSPSPKESLVRNIRQFIGFARINLQEILTPPYTASRDYSLQMVVPEGLLSLEALQAQNHICKFDLELSVFDTALRFEYDARQKSSVSKSGTCMNFIADFETNAIYITLEDGSFLQKGMRNIQVTMQVRTQDGTFIDRISRTEPYQKMASYDSTVYPRNKTPSWKETLRLDLSSSEMQTCHLFFTFRNCSPNDLASQDRDERNFAFAFLPLAKGQGIVEDSSHCLTLYHFDFEIANPSLYLNFPAGPRIFAPTNLSSSSLESLAASADAMAKRPALKDVFNVKTQLFSSALTQDGYLSSFLNWRQTVFLNRGDLTLILSDLVNVKDDELLKFYPSLVLACLDIFLVASQPLHKLNAVACGSLGKVLYTLVLVLNFGINLKFEKTVRTFEESLSKKLESLPISELLAKQITILFQGTTNEAPQYLKSVIKVMHILIRFIHLTTKDQESAKEIVSLMLGAAYNSSFQVEFLVASAPIFNDIQKAGIYGQDSATNFNTIRSMLEVAKPVAYLNFIRLDVLNGLIETAVFPYFTPSVYDMILTYSCAALGEFRDSAANGHDRMDVCIRLLGKLVTTQSFVMLEKIIKPLADMIIYLDRKGTFFQLIK